MDPETATLLVGVLFLLIAIIGGGFSIKEITIPSIPKWARITSAILGLAFILLFVSTSLSVRISNFPASGTIILHTDDKLDVTPQNIGFIHLEASAPHNPPLVNDVVSVKFSIRNIGSTPIKLDSGTFLGVRNPNGQNLTNPRQNISRTIQPNEVVETDASVLVDSKGSWELWPCYKLVDEGIEGGFCPSEWKSFTITVR